MDVLTRKDAHERGLKKFYTGKPCKYGHNTQRYVVTGACVTCCSNAMLKLRKKYKEPARPPMIKMTVELANVEEVNKLNLFLKGLAFERSLTAIANGYDSQGNFNPK